MSLAGFAMKAAPSIIGGLFGAFGQSSANKQNLRIAREQMAFQERMSNTAYTRAARDLENAGLNRILALGSPASSPGGASAVMGNIGAAGMEGAVAGANSARTSKLMNAELDNLVAGAEATRAGTALSRVNAAKGAAEIGLITKRGLREDQMIRTLEGWADVGDVISRITEKLKDKSEPSYLKKTAQEAIPGLINDINGITEGFLNSAKEGWRNVKEYGDRMDKENRRKGYK